MIKKQRSLGGPEVLGSLGPWRVGVLWVSLRCAVTLPPVMQGTCYATITLGSFSIGIRSNPFGYNKNANRAHSWMTWCEEQKRFGD